MDEETRKYCEIPRAKILLSLKKILEHEKQGGALSIDGGGLGAAISCIPVYQYSILFNLWYFLFKICSNPFLFNP
jgi:hypothetical protein